MTISDAAEKLKEMYFSAPERQKALRVHLFGIKYADQIAGMNSRNLAELAGLSANYGAERIKGKRLAPFVELKK